MRQNTVIFYSMEALMVSHCCQADIYIAGQENYYYCCDKCNMACVPIQELNDDSEMGNDNTGTEL
jgi:hypothetical protein